MNLARKIGRGLTLALGVSAVTAAELRVVGSDLLGLEFTKAFYEFSGRKGVRLALALDGSRPGLADLKADRADLALLILPPAELSLLDDFETRPLGYVPVLIGVPAGCPITEITFEQLALVFGAGEGLRAPVHWKDLGVAGEWSEKLILPLVPQGALGVGADFFRQVVLNEASFNTAVRRYASPRDLVEEFPSDSRAIALVSAIPVGMASRLRAIPVARRAGQRAVAPTPENLYTGNYPLRLTVHLVFRTDRRLTLTALFDFLWSDAAARELERADVVPVPSKYRAELRQRMESKDNPDP